MTNRFRDESRTTHPKPCPAHRCSSIGNVTGSRRLAGVTVDVTQASQGTGLARRRRAGGNNLSFGRNAFRQARTTVPLKPICVAFCGFRYSLLAHAGRGGDDHRRDDPTHKRKAVCCRSPRNPSTSCPSSRSSEPGQPASSGERGTERERAGAQGGRAADVTVVHERAARRSPPPANGSRYRISFCVTRCRNEKRVESRVPPAPAFLGAEEFAP